MLGVHAIGAPIRPNPARRVKDYCNCYSYYLTHVYIRGFMKLFKMGRILTALC